MRKVNASGASWEAGFVWCCHALKGQGSGLLAAPLALNRPPEELLYMPRHVHGVVQVEVSVRIQHRVTPATGHRVEPNHTQTSWQHITKKTSRSNKTLFTHKLRALTQSSSYVQRTC